MPQAKYYIYIVISDTCAKWEGKLDVRSKGGGSPRCHQRLCFTPGDARGPVAAHLQLCPLAQHPEQGDLLLVPGCDAQDLVPAGRHSHQSIRQASGDVGGKELSLQR